MGQESGNDKIGPSLGGIDDKYGRGRVSLNTQWGIIAAASGQVLEPNPKRVWATLINDGNEYIWIALGQAAVVNSGIRLNPNGGSFTIDSNAPWTGSVHAIGSGSVNLVGVEVSLA